MKIAVAGAGGVGGLLGGLLARSGSQVAVLARGAHADAIRANGLQVDSPLGSFAAPVVAVSEDPARLGATDAVLVAVKAWQVEELAPRLAPLLAGGGFVVPLQNGVESADRLARALGDERVAGGVIACLAWIERPGLVKHVGGSPRVKIGERGKRSGHPSPRLEALAAALRAGGAVVEVVPDIERETWLKFLLVEPWGAVAAAARAPIGVVRSVPETRALLVGALNELADVAQARGVAIGEEAVERTLAALARVPFEATASMQRDLGAGRPSELFDQLGAVVRLAREAGVSVPIHDVLHATLVPQERAARAEMPPFTRS